MKRVHFLLKVMTNTEKVDEDNEDFILLHLSETLNMIV